MRSTTTLTLEYHNTTTHPSHLTNLQILTKHFKQHIYYNYNTMDHSMMDHSNMDHGDMGAGNTMPMRCNMNVRPFTLAHSIACLLAQVFWSFSLICSHRCCSLGTPTTSVSSSDGGTSPPLSHSLSLLQPLSSSSPATRRSARHPAATNPTLQDRAPICRVCFFLCPPTSIHKWLLQSLKHVSRVCGSA